jgi:hypothetical protein
MQNCVKITLYILDDNLDGIHYILMFTQETSSVFNSHYLTKSNFLENIQPYVDFSFTEGELCFLLTRMCSLL